MTKNVLSWGQIAKQAAYLGSLTGLGYFVGITLMHWAGMGLGDWINWVYRIAVITAIVWTIMALRLRNPAGLSFLKAYSGGLMVSAVLGLWMMASAFIFYGQIAPDYLQEYETFYVRNREAQMYKTQLKNINAELAEDQAAKELTAQDSLIVQNGLEKHMEGTAYFFSVSGQAVINLIYSLVWGLLVSLPVAYMSMSKKE
ncbi:DUF4199 domain-containing protein [Saprospira sp. CCB-QB6]|uniref:DUF4199 domain-containing protein n=1 Tax=Saprospira sp. CCB-QB6 TaxID=3023936 RepID=UPI00234A14BE|nr:DUF4199 domain-containing protein [Saprospira sp. CCB-QB6]WCL81934.1 DUF4199 domain-containing protein [Saprospira sp. CCB-QB6]